MNQREDEIPYIGASPRIFPTVTVLLTLLLVPLDAAHAQDDVRIYVDSTAQIIRGFGAANIVGWRPDMTEAEIETAFGTGDGQLGFSILRVRIPPDRNQWNVNLASATRAHEMGATIIASPWSPPASMKTNNNLVGGRLRDDRYAEYAAYLDDFNTYMSDNGIPLYGLSVQNEPDVQVTYESCDWNPEQMTRFMRENADVINTRVIAPESFQFRRVLSDPILLDPEAAENLDILGGHIYGGGLSAYPLAQEMGKEVWMTEHLVLQTELDANIATGVEIQNVMKAGMSAYIWWYIVRYYGPISDGEEGSYEKGEITKRGYVMSQFSRFIRPGAHRVHTAEPRRQTGVTTTAYRDGDQLVVVGVNAGASVRDVHYTVEGPAIGSGPRYVTSATQNVAQMEDVVPVDNQFIVTLEPMSVTTIVLHETELSSEGTPPRPAHRLHQNYPNPFTLSTAFTYILSNPEEVTLEVFDLMGRKVATLARGSKPAGTHRVSMNADPLPAGVYFYQLRAGDVVTTRRMTVVR